MVQLACLILSIIILVVFAAGVVPFALYSASVILALGTLYVAWCARRRDEAPRYSLIVSGAIIIIWLLITLLPLSNSVWRVASNERANIYAQAGTALITANELKVARVSKPAFSLSLNRAGTWRIIILLLGAFAAAWLAASMPTSYKQHYLRFLVIAGVIIACAGLLGRYVLAPGNSVWWLLDIQAKHSLACFVNPNHYGAFLAMLCPAVLAFAVRDVEKREWERLGLWVAALAIFTAGIIASESRGAYLIFCLSLLATGLLFLSRKNARASIGLAAFVCLGFLAIACLGTPSMDRELRALFHRKGQNFPRIALCRDSLGISRDFALCGLGAEGFRTISPRYARQTPSSGYFHHAESTYVQFLVDGGIIGLILIGGLALCYGREALRHFRLRGRSRTVFISAAGAIAVILAHAVYDFGLHVPLYGIVAGSFFGLFLGRPSSQSLDHDRNRNLSSARLKQAIPLIPLLALLLILSVWFTYGRDIHVRDKYAYVQQATPEQLAENLSWAPAWWANWYYLGRAACNSGTWGGRHFGESCISRAALLNPRNLHIWKQLAILRWHLGKSREAQLAYNRYVALLPASARNRLRGIQELLPKGI